MNNQVSRLQISESVRVQTDALALLQASLGYEDSEDAIERAVVEVAERMGAVEQALHLEDYERLLQSARGLGAIGEQLGFSILSEVAEDVAKCAERLDLPALHAVSERLIRVGDASLTAAIEEVSLPY